MRSGIKGGLRMEIRKLMSIAIAFGMLAVSFAMVTPQNAKADFIEVLAGVPWGPTFTPRDIAFSDDGHYAVMVGQETTAGTNVWGWNGFTNSWYMISGAPMAQTMTSVCYYAGSDIFVMCGDSGGSNTVYYLNTGFNMLNPLGHSTAANAIAVDGTGNILVGGATTMYSYDWVSWSPHTLGSPYTVRSITFNVLDQRFYVAAYDSGASKAALFYSDAAPLTGGSVINPAIMPISVPDIRSIDWNPASGRNYGLAVGTGVYKINPYEGNATFTMKVIEPASPFETFYDVAWDIDGWNEAAIFGQNVTMNQAVYYRYYHTNPTLILGFQDPAIALYACGGIKPPGSPKFAFAPAAGGGIMAHIQAFDQSTRLTAIALFPKVFWIGFNDTAYNPRLDQQVMPDTNYLFTLEANYSLGWTDCDVVVQAWYDNGFTAAGGSAYPAETDGNRNLAFTLVYDTLTAVHDITYPAGDLEFADISVTETEIMTPNPASDPGNNRRLAFEINFGPQARMADYGAVAPIGPLFDTEPLIALNNPHSWDFSVTVRDRALPAAAAVKYGEFGVQTLSSVTVTGNPSGAAPPGTWDNPMVETSQITYSSNAPYFVNVSIPDLYLGGNPASLDWIPATDVSVMNIEPRADAATSGIDGWTYFTGPNTYLYVWGLNLAPLAPVGNGTISNGVYISDYNAAANAANTYTELAWRVTVIAGTPEGMYWGVITVSIEN